MIVNFLTFQIVILNKQDMFHVIEVLKRFKEMYQDSIKFCRYDIVLYQENNVLNVM